MTGDLAAADDLSAQHRATHASGGVSWRTSPRIACSARITWVIALASAALGTGFARAGTEVRDLSLSTSSKGAALTVELSRTTTYKLFTLENPHRVVIDLNDTQRGRSARLPHAAGIVQSVRTGPRPHGALRLVLQLQSSMPAHVRWSSPKHAAMPRLLITVGADTGALAALAVGSNSAEHASVSAPVTPTSTPPHPSISIAVPPPSTQPRPTLSLVVPPASMEPNHSVSVAHAPTSSDRDVVVAVDAGHGGQDSGAIGRSGTQEKNVVLSIALALAARIDAEPGMRAILTRSRDEFLPLRERIRRARGARADLFVSVHADSIRDSHVSGSSVYVLSERGATDESARWLAERENSADLMGGVSLADKDSRLASVLLDLSQSANISSSMTAAQRVLGALADVGEVRKPQVQQAGFVVLKSPDIPSMLIETAYISNPTDERRLRTANEQHKLAAAIFEGLRAYFEKYPPAGTHFASEHPTGPASAVLAGAATVPSVTLTR